jgi:hypothetical protein
MFREPCNDLVKFITEYFGEKSSFLYLLNILSWIKKNWNHVKNIYFNKGVFKKVNLKCDNPAMTWMCKCMVKEFHLFWCLYLDFGGVTEQALFKMICLSNHPLPTLQAGLPFNMIASPSPYERVIWCGIIANTCLKSKWNTAWLTNHHM